MNPSYRVPTGIQVKRIHNRYLVSTTQGGKVSLDAKLYELWKQADGHSLSEVIDNFREKEDLPTTIRAALACLVQAGLLSRTQGPESNSLNPIEISNGALVSAIIVGYNGREWLQDCIPSLLAQTYRQLEVILVDNASTDRTQEWLQESFPQVKLMRLEEPVSLAEAINRGVTQATGDYFLILNQDIRMDPGALAQMMTVIQDRSSCAAVAPKLLFSWASSFINGIGNRVGAFSWGVDNGLGHLDLGQFDSWDEVPSACFAATLVARRAWEAVGPVDSGFPLYYEDTEWCYRARLLGYTILAAPQAIVYHAFSGRIPSGHDQGLSLNKLENVVYGRLRFSIRLLSNAYLLRFTSSYFLEDIVNIAWALLRLHWKKAKTYLLAWKKFLLDLSTLRRQRQILQAQRVRTDGEIFTLQRHIPPSFIWRGMPELTWDLVRFHYQTYLLTHMTDTLPELKEPSQRPRLLIISKDKVDVKMGGIGMRNLEMARALSRDIDVTLAHPSPTELEISEIRLVEYQESQPEALRLLVETMDVTLISTDIFERFAFLQNSNTRLVIDLYVPFILESLHYYLDEPFSIQESFSQPTLEITNRLACLGDFFICGSERQRDFWLGVLAANGRVNPRNYAKDPTLRALVDVVTIGFPDRQPHCRPILRGIHPAIPTEARIVIWGGGIWEWLDPLTLVRAWPQVIEQHPYARLIFMGIRHPNPQVPEHKMAKKTLALAAEIGEKDRSILFFDWVPYEDREAFLCESDIGVTLHPAHIETHYSIRTRMLDYLWTKLPILISDGDVTSEWVRQYNLGRVVPPRDVQAVVQTLCEMLEQPKSAWDAAFEPLHNRFSWPKVVEPLRRYCLEGDYAADRALRDKLLLRKHRRINLRQQLGRAYYIWRNEGFKAFLHRTWRYVQWYLSRP